MALESFGEDIARMVDKAVTACHDLVLDECGHPSGVPTKPVEQVQFKAGQEGMWSVFPSMLDGKPAVEIRLAVG